ncbi:MAG: glutathione S-transferase family protein [Rhodobiaceae bacterium]|nr:glutathione S-transferase family protein [Rhodobiaceae bacterium]MCC0056547.1 glutathione S-transferase family protein [Rhodobiaceae bacterium]
MSENYPVILHHGLTSPFSEKIRIALGYKQLRWKSVVVPRVMPRPDLMPLTGGYRRTPTMQIGADIYCDTQMILHELDRRFPDPPLVPRHASGITWGLLRWTDGAFFTDAMNLVLAENADHLPPEFVEDREALFGQAFDFARMKSEIPFRRDQVRAQLAWIEDQLAAGGDWLMGEFSLADIHAYLNIWFCRNHSPRTAELLAAFPNILAWESRMVAIGHGSREEIAAAEALEIAASASPQALAHDDPGELNGRRPGDRVSVTPYDYGCVPVSGEIVALSANHIAIRRYDERAGDIVVHFPRVGFVIEVDDGISR